MTLVCFRPRGCSDVALLYSYEWLYYPSAVSRKCGYRGRGRLVPVPFLNPPSYYLVLPNLTNINIALPHNFRRNSTDNGQSFVTP
jgi:hypothetical protein